MGNIMTFLKDNWKYLLIILLVIVSIGIIWYEWREHRSVPQATLPTVQQGQYVTKEDLMAVLASLGKDSSINHTTTLRETIIEREKKPADTQFTTKTTVEADKKAKEIAKANSADYLLKQPKSVGSDIQNYYYGITEEKNFKIKGGMTFGEYSSMNIGASYKKLEIIYHKSTNSSKGDSITGMYTIFQR